MTTADPEHVALFRSIFERHYDALFGYAIRRTASREDAEEIVATTFATAWRRIDQLPPEPLAITWLYRVAWKTLANHYRGANRRTNLVNRLAGMRSAENLESDADGDDGVVQQALSRLRPGEQEVLRLIAWEELSYIEAAAVLNCTPNAFAIRLHRARSSLRQELERLGHARPDLESGQQDA